MSYSFRVEFTVTPRYKHFDKQSLAADLKNVKALIHMMGWDVTDGTIKTVRKTDAQ